MPASATSRGLTQFGHVREGRTPPESKPPPPPWPPGPPAAPPPPAGPPPPPPPPPGAPPPLWWRAWARARARAARAVPAEYSGRGSRQERQAGEDDPPEPEPGLLIGGLPGVGALDVRIVDHDLAAPGDDGIPLPDVDDLTGDRHSDDAAAGVFPLDRQVDHVVSRLDFRGLLREKAGVDASNRAQSHRSPPSRPLNY